MNYFKVSSKVLIVCFFAIYFKMSLGKFAETIVLNAKSAHTATVILMHGVGDSGQGISGLGQFFQALLPHVNFIVPTAEFRAVTRFGGQQMNSWFNIEGHADKSLEPNEGIDASVVRIRELLASEHAAGIPYNRMVLAGFSQGGCMSLFTGLQLSVEQKLGGLLILSSFLPSILRFKLTPGLEETRVFHTHGKADTMITETQGVKTREHIVGLGLTRYDLKLYPDTPHTVSPEIRRDALAYLQEILPVIGTQEL